MKIDKRIITFILLFAAIQTGWAASKMSPIYIQVKENKINQLYIAMLDRDIGEAIKRSDPVSGYLATPANPVTPENVFSKRFTALGNMPQQTANLAGAMAYAYTIPTSKYYQEPMSLNRVRLILDTFAKRQNADGALSADPDPLENTLQTAFLLEPLIQAFSLIASNLPDTEQRRFRAVLEQGVRYLSENEIHSPSADGAVWCGIMALGSQFTGKAGHLDAARRAFKRIRPMVTPSGGIADPQGLDYFRSVLSIQYLFLYRLMSGDIDADEPLVHSLKWITRLCASDGLPLNGVNYWPISFLRTKMANLLGALTYYAGRDPEFAPVATRYLESLMDLPVGFSLEHGGGYFLRGAQYHDRPETLDPIPYQPYLESYSFGNRSHYFLVGKNYQTALDLRSTVPFKGLQTWIYRGQKPIVAPAPNVRSRMLAFGYDSHRMNVPAAGMAVPCYIASVSPDVDIVAVPDETIQTAYIFSRDTTVVVYSQAPGPGLLDWAQYAPVCASVKEIKAGSITFEGTDARLLIPNVVPSVETQGDGTRIRMRFNSESFWYALVGPQSKSVVKHVLSGVFLVHLNESGRIVNFALNLSSQPFSETMFFPGTSIPVPALEPYDAKVVQGE